MFGSHQICRPMVLLGKLLLEALIGTLPPQLWISDGTQDQWTTPAGSSEAYPKGVSTGYVPDMWYDASGNDIPSCDGLTTCPAAGAT